MKTPPVFVRDKHVYDHFGISPTHARRLSKAGLFARRIKLGPGIVGYFYDEGRQKLLDLPNVPDVEERIKEVVLSETKKHLKS